MTLRSRHVVLATGGLLVAVCGWFVADMLRMSARPERQGSGSFTARPAEQEPSPRDPSDFREPNPPVEVARAPESDEPVAPDGAMEDIAHYTLEQAFAKDAPGSSVSVGKEVAIREAFSSEAVTSLGGHLTQVDCKASVCRGELLLPDRQADNRIFSEVVLGGDLGRKVPGAFTVASRKEMPDGSIQAVFFVHPDEVLVNLVD